MAEQKELRRMNRTELIEIIYALQQQEQDLRRENKELSERLEDRAIRLESSGSIAEAALSLNHIFEDAQAAAEQYLMSVTEGGSQTEDAKEPEDARESGAAVIITDIQDKALEETRPALDSAQQSVDEAREKAETIVSEARDEAEHILASAQAEAEQTMANTKATAEQILASAQFQADEIRRKGKQAAANERDKFLREVRHLLDESPELALAMRERARREDGV